MHTSCCDKNDACGEGGGSGLWSASATQPAKGAWQPGALPRADLSACAAQGKLFGRLANYFTPQPVDDCLEVLELVLLGGQAITPIMSSSSEIIQLDWQVAGDSAVRERFTHPCNPHRRPHMTLQRKRPCSTDQARHVPYTVLEGL